VEKILFFSGLASVLGGFGVIMYQGITFLKSGAWTPLTVMGAIGTESGLGQTLAANPAVMDALQKCPLSAALIALGVIMLLIASKLRSRFD